MDNGLIQLCPDLIHGLPTRLRNLAKRSAIRFGLQVQCLIQHMAWQMIGMCHLADGHPSFDGLITMGIPIDRVADQADRVIARERHHQYEQDKKNTARTTIASYHGSRRS